MDTETQKAIDDLMHFSKRATLETPGDPRLRMAAFAVSNKLESLDRKYTELCDFMRNVCLLLQRHRSASDAEMDLAFQNCYRLTVKHEIWPRNSSQVVNQPISENEPV